MHNNITVYTLYSYTGKKIGIQREYTPYQRTVFVPGLAQTDIGVAGVRKWGAHPGYDDPGALGACGVSANGGRKVVKVFIQARPHRCHGFLNEISSLRGI